jgi:hypothetical protein
VPSEQRTFVHQTRSSGLVRFRPNSGPTRRPPSSRQFHDRLTTCPCKRSGAKYTAASVTAQLATTLCASRVRRIRLIPNRAIRPRSIGAFLPLRRTRKWPWACTRAEAGNTQSDQFEVRLSRPTNCWRSACSSSYPLRLGRRRRSATPSRALAGGGQAADEGWSTGSRRDELPDVGRAVLGHVHRQRSPNRPHRTGAPPTDDARRRHRSDIHRAHST